MLFFANVHYFGHAPLRGHPDILNLGLHFSCIAGNGRICPLVSPVAAFPFEMAPESVIFSIPTAGEPAFIRSLTKILDIGVSLFMRWGGVGTYYNIHVLHLTAP